MMIFLKFIYYETESENLFDGCYEASSDRWTRFRVNSVIAINNQKLWMRDVLKVLEECTRIIEPHVILFQIAVFSTK